MAIRVLHRRSTCLDPFAVAQSPQRHITSMTLAVEPDLLLQVAAMPLLACICRGSVQEVVTLVTLILVAYLAAGVAG